MRTLVAFALRRRFCSMLTAVFNLLVAAAIVALFFLDVLAHAAAGPVTAVYLDDTTRGMHERFESFVHDDFHYEVSSRPCGDTAAILHFDGGWTVYSAKALDQGMMDQIRADVGQVIAERYLAYGDAVTDSFINDYRREIANQVVQQTDQGGDAYLWIIESVVYFMILGYGSAIASDVVYEKATHMLEVLLTAVDAETHFRAKVVTGYMSLAIQGGLGAVYVLVGFLLRYRYDRLAGLIAYGRQTLAAYGCAAVPTGLAVGWPAVVLSAALIGTGVLTIQVIMLIIASQLSSPEDASGLQGPFYVALLLGYYALMYYGEVADMQTPAGLVLSQLPISSMLVMPVRLLLAAAPWWQGVTALAMALAGLKAVTVLGMPFYQRGILDYRIR